MTSVSIDFESIEKLVIQIQSRSRSDPSPSDIDFKNKMSCVWNTLNWTTSNHFDIISKVNEKSWEIVNLCGPPGHFLDSCTDSYWSTEYPDPKSELTPIKENGQIR